MFERFTDRARRVVVLAQEEAKLLGHNYIGTEHLLLGLIREGEGVGAKAMEQLGIALDAARTQVEEIIGRGGSVPEGNIPFTPRAKKVLELSLRESLQLGHNYIGTEHVLLGLVREGEGVASQCLVRMGASLGRVRTTVVGILAGHGVTGREITGTRPPGGGVDIGRFSPGLLSALHAAAARASQGSAIGTHHVLSVLAEWDDLAAYGVLRAGGFDAAGLEVPIADWDVAGTRDETEDEWGQRVTEVDTEDDAVVVRLRDPGVLLRVRRALAAGAGEEIKLVFGRVVRQLESRLPAEPAEPAERAERAEPAERDERDEPAEGDDPPPAREE